MRVDDLALFVRAAALGSFSGAARERDLLPGQVSAAIRRLERSLGVALFARSTRSLRLTGEGEAFLPHATRALDALREGRESWEEASGRLTGTLQIAAPADLGRHLLLPWLIAFRRDHPSLTLRLHLSDRVADVFREPVDLAIRYGVVDEASYVSMPLADWNRRVLVASPDYLARHGTPRTLDALREHPCLLYQLDGRVYDRWRFLAAGERRVVTVRGPVQVDAADVVRQLAIDGEGIAYKSWLDVSHDVRAGRLRTLLDDCVGDAVPLRLVCPHRRQFTPAVRLLRERLRGHCETLRTGLPVVQTAGGA